jgi:recombinational DNA repair protein (RecF pathway)
MIGPHTFNKGPWHNCMRCDRKTKLARLNWQRGLLLCPICWDPYPLEGQREQAIANKLMDGKVDFKVSKKLTDPVVDTDDLMM